VSGLVKISSTVRESLPTDLHHSMAEVVSFVVGASVSVSVVTCDRENEKTFCLKDIFFLKIL
jgi:hypothetical protein